MDPFTTEEDSLLREIQDLFTAAENRIYTFGDPADDDDDEDDDDGAIPEISIPAVNQLRYAGQHLLRALTETASGQERLCHLWEARNHCRRALYDASEPGLMYLISRHETFQLQYKVTWMREALPDYLEIRRKVRDAQNLIRNCESKVKERAEYANECALKTDELWDDIRRLEDAQPLFEERANEETRRQVENGRRARRWWIGTAIAIVMLLVTLAGVAVQYASNKTQSIPLATTVAP